MNHLVFFLYFFKLFSIINFLKDSIVLSNSIKNKKNLSEDIINEYRDTLMTTKQETKKKAIFDYYIEIFQKIENLNFIINFSKINSKIKVDELEIKG